MHSFPLPAPSRAEGLSKDPSGLVFYLLGRDGEIFEAFPTRSPPPPKQVHGPPGRSYLLSFKLPATWQNPQLPSIPTPFQHTVR